MPIRLQKFIDINASYATQKMHTSYANERRNLPQACSTRAYAPYIEAE
jgi:hypothetical protein